MSNGSSEVGEEYCRKLWVYARRGWPFSYCCLEQLGLVLAATV